MAEQPDMPEEYIHSLSEYYGRLKCIAYADGDITREDLIETLSDWKYFQAPARGTFALVVGWALDEGHIDEGILEEIEENIVRQRFDEP